MVEFCKGTTWIGSKTIYVNIYVELNEKRNDYISGIGANVDVEEIANKVLEEDKSFDNAFPMLDADYFCSVEVYSDDCYDDETLDDLLCRRKDIDLTEWNKEYKSLYESEQKCKYEGKYYNCLIEIFREI